jgi:hypothetical protein
VRGKQLLGCWLVGLGLGSITLAAVHGRFAMVGFPFLIATAGFLILRRPRQRAPRFPGTDLERALERLLALLFPSKPARATTTRSAIAQQVRLAGLRRGVRRWGAELQLITTDGYETTSRLSALCPATGEHDDQALMAEAVRVLRAERCDAGANVALADDPVSILAYGLGARPTDADLTSLEDLLADLGLAGETDELHARFDGIIASRDNRRTRGEAERIMFRDLAGASFVLGASRRILELASTAPAYTPLVRATAAKPA